MSEIYMPSIDDELRKAVKEYYEWNGDSNAEPIRFVVNKMPGQYKLLLVRFTDKLNCPMSALMEYQEWNDGHWDVTEVDFIDRIFENNLVCEFENSEDFI